MVERKISESNRNFCECPYNKRALERKLRGVTDWDMGWVIVTKVVKARRGAKSVRVSYRVSATDSGDAAVNATCKPASGSRFALGRTRVTCEASDSSANAATASFVVLVKATR